MTMRSGCRTRFQAACAALTAAAIALLGVLPSSSARAAGGDDDAERIRRAVVHTLSTQLPSGLFAYDFDFLSAEPTGQDNIVRQAGTLFALGEYLVETRDASVVPAMRAGFAALAERSLPLGRGALQAWLEWVGVFDVRSGRLRRALDSAGLLYDAQGQGLIVSEDGSYETAYAGATALALIAELHYARVAGDERFRTQREGWLTGLLALHVAGRGMRGDPATLAESAYANGETWLALASYHERFPEDARVAEALAALEPHLLARYAGEPSSQFYHWGAIAGAVRYAAAADAAVRQRLVDFAARQAEYILEKTLPEKSRKHTTCSLVEGLASSVPVLEASGAAQHQPLVARMRTRVASELAHNRALQIAPGQMRRPLAAGGSLSAPSLAGHAGAFLAGPYVAYTRTDLTQHCISALLKAGRMGAGGPGAP